MVMRENAHDNVGDRAVAVCSMKIMACPWWHILILEYGTLGFDAVIILYLVTLM